MAALKRSVTVRYEGFPKVTKRYIQIRFTSVGQMKGKCDSEECQSSSWGIEPSNPSELWASVTVLGPPDSSEEVTVHS